MRPAPKLKSCLGDSPSFDQNIDELVGILKKNDHFKANSPTGSTRACFVFILDL